MVLNHVWARPTAQGGVDYFPPDEVTPDRTPTKAGRPAARCADGSAVEYRGMLKMGKTERNGVDPQELIDRYGADTARLFVMFASPPEQTLDWNDAGVEGANRFLQAALEVRREARRRRSPRRRPRQSSASGGSALRHEIHARAAPGQLRLRADAIQHRRLRGDEAAQRARGARRRRRAPTARRCARASASCCACSIRSARTPPGCCGASSATTRDLGDLLDAPWPEVDERALVQDEIELMLQINGKLRGTIRVPAKLRQGGRSRRRRWPARSSRKFAEGAAGQAGHRRAGPAGQHRRLMPASPRVLVLALGRVDARRLRLRAAARPRAALPDDPAHRLPAALAARRRAEAPHRREHRRPAWSRPAKDAEVVLQALDEERARRASVATTAASQMREFELRSRFRFALRTAGGRS